MPRMSTQFQDRSIFKLLLRGIPPKIISLRLSLSSVHVVYNAMRRNRSTWNIDIKTKLNKIQQTQI